MPSDSQARLPIDPMKAILGNNAGSISVIVLLLYGWESIFKPWVNEITALRDSIGSVVDGVEELSKDVRDLREVVNTRASKEDVSKLQDDVQRLQNDFRDMQRRLVCVENPSLCTRRSRR